MDIEKSNSTIIDFLIIEDIDTEEILVKKRGINIGEHKNDDQAED